MFAEWLTMLRLRLRSLLNRRRLEDDLDDEMRFHLEKKQEALRAAGVDAAEAGFAARREFGNAVLIKETNRDQWTFPTLESIWQDFRFGARLLRRNKAFAAAGTLSLALGIAANTSIFMLIDAVMLAKLPVRNPDDLVVLNWTGRAYNTYMTNASGRDNRMNVFTYAAFERFREGSTLLEPVFAFTPMYRTAVALRDRTELVQGLLVSGEFYDGMGVQPLLGRLLSESDDRRGAPLAAVLSYRFWRSAFRSDPAAVGSSITVNGVPVIVAGVTPPRFYGPSIGGPVPSPDVTLALAMQPEVDKTLGDGSIFFGQRSLWLNVMGRLEPGANLARAEAELNALFQPVNSAAGIGDLKAVVLPGGRGLENTRAMFETPLTILSVAGGLVLLVACANLATLLLARGTARAGEVAVRLAIGAGRLRVMRQLLTESLLLSGIAAALGGVLGYWGCRALIRWLVQEPEAFPLSLAPSLRLIAFLAAVSAVTGILFGLAPAFRVSRGARPGRGIHAGRFAQGLIVVQVALSLVLVVGAGLFVRTLWNLRNVDIGFNSQQVLLFNIDPSLHRYEGDRLLGFHRDLRLRLAGSPGVLSASVARLRLLSGGMSGSPAEISGSSLRPQVHINDVGPGFFDTMGIRVLLGRAIDEGDDARAPKVAVINESMAKAAFAAESPIGRTFTLYGGQGPYQVVGVAADALYSSLKQAPPPTVYIPYEQFPFGTRGLYYLIRTAGSPEAFIPTARSIVRDLDPGIPMSQVSTQERVIDDQLLKERMFANLATCFGALALLLAAIGIYGVIAYAAARRTGEIGVRTALGAGTGDIVWMMLRSTALLSTIGVACGIAGAMAVTKYLDAAILFGVEPDDPATYVAGAGILLGVALLAGFLPARRASRIDPIVALRCE